MELSQKDVNRLSMAGNFVQELMKSDDRNSRPRASHIQSRFSYRGESLLAVAQLPSILASTHTRHRVGSGEKVSLKIYH